MPVDEDVDLNKPLTQEDIDRLNREAEEAEQIVREHEEAEREMEKIYDEAQKSKKNIEKTEKEVNQAANRLLQAEGATGFRNPLAGMGGSMYTPDDPLGFGGMFRGDDDMGAIPAKSRHTKVLDKSPMGEMRRNIESFRQRMMRLQEQQIEQGKSISKLQGLMGEATSLISNPIGVGFGKLRGSLMGKIGAGSIWVTIAITIADFLWTELQNTFKPGGINDIRKLMEDRDREIVELEDILARRAGRVFFTGDVDLRQGAPQFSNTERLRDQVLRYEALHLGE